MKKTKILTVDFLAPPFGGGEGWDFVSAGGCWGHPTDCQFGTPRKAGVSLTPSTPPRSELRIHFRMIGLSNFPCLHLFFMTWCG